MDTQQIKGMKEEVRDRFRSCLEDREGSVAALQAALEKKKSFLIDLNQAYQSSLYEGTREMLGQLDPQPIAEAHRKPIIGVDHGEAWKALGRVQNDLASASRNEMWERFFFEPFRSRLSRHLEPSGD
jgi:predicted component of type VI protein secretion system